jgi:hypothetical protein
VLDLAEAVRRALLRLPRLSYLSAVWYITQSMRDLYAPAFDVQTTAAVDRVLELLAQYTTRLHDLDAPALPGLASAATVQRLEIQRILVDLDPPAGQANVLMVSLGILAELAEPGWSKGFAAERIFHPFIRHPVDGVDGITLSGPLRLAAVEVSEGSAVARRLRHFESALPLIDRFAGRAGPFELSALSQSLG